MYCIKCGKQIDDSARFCSSCGQKVGGSVKNIVDFFPKEEVKEFYQTTKSKGTEILKKQAQKKKINVFSFVCMIVAIGLCFFI